MSKRPPVIAGIYSVEALLGGNEGDQIIVTVAADDIKQRYSADQRPAHLRGRRMNARLPRHARASQDGGRTGKRACRSRRRTAAEPSS